MNFLPRTYVSLVLSIMLISFVNTKALALEESKGIAHTLERTEVRLYTSKKGEVYQIYLSWPETPPTTNGYPVIYALDGNENFAILTEVVRRMNKRQKATGIEPGLIVAIGYPKGQSRRQMDYTPSAPSDTPNSGKAKTGGAKAFSQFLSSELLPNIEAEFKVDKTRRGLFGHSFGGLFVLDVLVSDPSIYSTYIASSPSIWFSNKLVLTKLKNMKNIKNTLKGRKVVITAGEYEQAIPHWELSNKLWIEAEKTMKQRKMIDNAKEFAKVLESASLENIIFHEFPMETHASSIVPAIGHSLRFIF